jgi:hypothetical protein
MRDIIKWLYEWWWGFSAVSEQLHFGFPTNYHTNYHTNLRISLTSTRVLRPHHIPYDGLHRQALYNWSISIFSFLSLLTEENGTVDPNATAVRKQ